MKIHSRQTDVPEQVKVSADPNEDRKVKIKTAFNKYFVTPLAVGCLHQRMVAIAQNLSIKPALLCSRLH